MAKKSAKQRNILRGSVKIAVSIRFKWRLPSIPALLKSFVISEF